jgi:hypothetical protein
VTRLPMLRALRDRRRGGVVARPGARWRVWTAARCGRSRRDLFPGSSTRTWRRSVRPVLPPTIGGVLAGVAPPVRPSIGGAVVVVVVGSGGRPGPHPGRCLLTHRSIVTRRSSESRPGWPPDRSGSGGGASDVRSRRSWAPPRAPAPAPVLRTAAADAAPRRVDRGAAPPPSVRRYNRVEVPARSTSAGPTQITGLPAFRPAPPLGSTLAPAGDPTPSASPAAGPGPGPGPGSGAAFDAGPGGLPGVDVDRLTDQIVTRLDDRLIAHRERMGRAF